MKTAKGVIAAGTVNGNTSVVDLSAVFSAGEPLRAVMFFATKCDAAEQTRDPGGGTAATNIAELAFGWATNDGGSIQECYAVTAARDAVPNEDASVGIGANAALKGFTNGAGALDYVMNVTAFTNTGFTVTWTDAAAFPWRIHYFAIGGSDVDAARAIQFNASGATPQDVTIAAGWGQPDLMLFGLSSPSLGAGGGDVGTANAGLSLGAASDSESRCTVLLWQEGPTTMAHAMFQRDSALGAISTPGGVTTVTADGDLDVRANWPANGFRIVYATTPGANLPMIGLALKGSFTKKIGAAGTPAAVSETTIAGAGSGTAEGLLTWGWSMAPSAGLISTNTDLSAVFIGASDDTSEGSVAVTDQDGVGTSVAAVANSESKAVQIRRPAAATTLLMDADAVAGDGGASGDDWNLNWKTIASAAAREFNYLILGTLAAPTADTRKAKVGGVVGDYPLRRKVGGVVI